MEATSSIEVPNTQMAGGRENARQASLQSYTAIYIRSPSETGPGMDGATITTFMFLQPPIRLQTETS